MHALLRLLAMHWVFSPIEAIVSVFVLATLAYFHVPTGSCLLDIMCIVESTAQQNELRQVEAYRGLPRSTLLLRQDCFH